MNSSNGRTALITGASAGIGEAIAREYARHGCNLVLVARRRERLDELAAQLRDAHGVKCTVAPADLADPETPRALQQALDNAGIRVDILVNNAGYGVPGAYLASDWQTHRDFLRVMVTSVAELCHRFAPAMVEQGSGRIVNIASLAGHLPGTEGHTLYGPVKSWMIRFSESLAFELNDRGIHVTAVCPGFTYSEFHDVTGTREQVREMPDYMWMSAERVARETWEASARGDIVYVTGRVNRVIAWLARHLPRGLVYRWVRRRSKDFRKT